MIGPLTRAIAAGNRVMIKQVTNLTSVTLELGGKSTIIIVKDFDLTTAAKRVMYAKLINSGQTCVAQDYLFIPKGKEEEFIN